jgi:hypothetical protein
MPVFLLIKRLHDADHDLYEDEFLQSTDHDKIWVKVEEPCLQDGHLMETGGQLKMPIRKLLIINFQLIFYRLSLSLSSQDYL